MIKLEHVSKAYSAGIPALNDVNLEIEEGEFVFVVGDSGSGKSTLIKLLLKELEPTEGVITINGRKLHTIRHKQVPRFRRNLGVVFQDFRLLKDRNVYDNIAFAQRVVGASVRESRRRVPQMLSMVGLAAKYKSYPRQLSGGEQQRVAIARALAMKPKMLYFDEPTSALDPEITAEILRVLKELAAEKMTMVIVTHEIDFARAVSDRVIFMDEGMVVEEGRPEEVIDHPENERTKAFLQKLQV